MANSTAGKFWLLDTAGVVVDTAVKIKNVQVTWKVSSAGVLEMTTFNRNTGAGETFIYAQTLGATSAAQDQLTQIFPIDTWIPGINIKTITNVAKLIVQIE